jgi:hypothetical protein
MTLGLPHWNIKSNILGIPGYILVNTSQIMLIRRWCQWYSDNRLDSPLVFWGFKVVRAYNSKLIRS